MKDTPRIAYLKQQIAYYKKLGQRKNLTGNRPYVAVQMTLEVLEAELKLAQAGKQPMYKYQLYSNLANEVKGWK